MSQLVLIETYCWRALSTNEATRFFHALFAGFQTILAFPVVARLLQLARIENDSRRPFAANSAQWFFYTLLPRRFQTILAPAIVARLSQLTVEIFKTTDLL